MKTYGAVIVVILAVGGGIFFIQRGKEDNALSAAPGVNLASLGPSQSLFENPSEKLSPTADQVAATPDLATQIALPDQPPAGYIEYQNNKYHFLYWHSQEAKITEYDEGGGAATVVQENIAKQRGLQIFVVPYSGTTISDARFNKDEPSGVRYNIKDTTVGVKRIPAVTFNGYDETLGDTREVWFIHNGFLYEVTTLKGFGDWFIDIMQTWRFTD